MNGTQYRKKKNEQVREFVPTKNKYYRSQIKPKPQSRHDPYTVWKICGVAQSEICVQQYLMRLLERTNPKGRESQM